MALAAAIAVLVAVVVGVPLKMYRSASISAARSAKSFPLVASLSGFDAHLTSLGADFASCTEDLGADFIGCLEQVDLDLADFQARVSATRTAVSTAVEQETMSIKATSTCSSRCWAWRGAVATMGGAAGGGLSYLAWMPTAAPPPPPAQAAWPPVPHIVPMAPWVGPPREVPMAPWVDAPAPAVRSRHSPASNSMVADIPQERVVVASPDVEPEPSPPEPQAVAHTEGVHAHAHTPADDGEARAADDDGLAVDVERRPQLKLRAKRQRRRRNRSRRPRHDLRGATKRGRHHGAHTQQQPPSRCRHR